MKISLLALDVDGVITDGTVLYSATGDETKRVHFHDIDAVFAARRSGLQVALVTGEETPWVDFIARRLEVTLVKKGCKDKKAAVELLSRESGVPLDEICYVGDGDRDAAALAICGAGFAPANATPAAKKAADRVLKSSGGSGAVREAVDLILDGHHPSWR